MSLGLQNLLNLLMAKLHYTGSDVAPKVMGKVLFNLSDILRTVGASLSMTFGTLFYMLSYPFYMIIDFCSIIFKRILGLGDPYTIKLDGVNGGTTTVDGDLVLAVITSKTVTQVFISLSIIALFLLLISVIVAIIRSEYKFDKGGNAKGPIFGRAIKAFFYYISVPVVCVFGIWGASMLLKTVDQVTGGGSSYISSLVFSTCAGTGNRIRSDNDTWTALKIELNQYSGEVSNTTFSRAFLLGQSGSASIQTIMNQNADADTREQCAEYIDSLFASAAGTNGTKGIVPSGGNTGGFKFAKAARTETFNTSSEAFKGCTNVTGVENQDEAYDIYVEGFKFATVSVNGLFSSQNAETGGMIASPYNLSLVYFYYDLMFGGFNHILSLLASYLLVKVLFDLACGVVKRVYELVVLFVISPPIVALMPLDEGSAYSKWVKQFVGKTLMAFGGVLAINFFFMLVPIFRTIKIFEYNGAFKGSSGGGSSDLAFFGVPGFITGLFNKLTQLLFVLAGAFSISSLSAMISDIIGGADAIDSGSKISGAVSGMAGKTVGVGVGIAKAAGKLAGKGIAGLVKKKQDPNKAKVEENQKELEKKADGDEDGSAPAPSGNGGGSGGGAGGGGKGPDEKGGGSKPGRLARFADIMLGAKGADGKRKAGGALGVLKQIGSMYTAGLKEMGAKGQGTGDGGAVSGFQAGSQVGENAFKNIAGTVGAVAKGAGKLAKPITKPVGKVLKKGAGLVKKGVHRTIGNNYHYARANRNYDKAQKQENIINNLRAERETLNGNELAQAKIDAEIARRQKKWDKDIDRYGYHTSNVVTDQQRKEQKQARQDAKKTQKQEKSSRKDANKKANEAIKRSKGK